MKLILWRRYEIEAAHQLTDGVPEGHRCRRLHGHRYIVQIGIEGNVQPNGMLIEYADLDTQVWPVLKRCDHYSLNTLTERHSGPMTEAFAANPTVELFCAWLVTALGFLSPTEGGAFRLAGIKVEEDSRASVEWRA